MKSIKKKPPKLTHAPILLDKVAACNTVEVTKKNSNMQTKTSLLCLISCLVANFDVYAAENTALPNHLPADQTQMQMQMNGQKIEAVKPPSVLMTPEITKTQDRSKEPLKESPKNQPSTQNKADETFTQLSEFQKQDMLQELFKMHDIKAQELGKIYTTGQTIAGQFDQKVTITDAQAWLNDAYIKAHAIDFDMLQQKIFASSALKSADVPHTEHEGEVYFKTPEVTAKAQTANYDIEAKTAELSDVFYILNQAQQKMTQGLGISNQKTYDDSLSNAQQKGWGAPSQNLGHGYAKTLKMPNSQTYQAENISHSFCPINDRVWHLNASNLTIDQRQDRMRIKNAKLVVGNASLAYFPYLDIPMRGQNQSGLLVPEAAVNSRTGFDISLPYYFALSPSYDATLTPRILSKRGLQTAGEFRYLLDDMQGQAQADFLFNDWQNKKNRWSYRLNHLQRVQTPKWLPDANLQINWQKVSDDDYPQDLGRDINQSTTRIYPQRVELSGALSHDLLAKGAVEGDWRIWHQRYQTLKPNAAPYNQDIALELEQNLNLEKWLNKPKLSQSFLKWQHQSVYLNNPDLTQNKKAARMVNDLTLSKRWQNDAFFSEPSVKLQHIQYVGDLVGVDQKPVRKSIVVPTFKWDAGLFLERKIYQKDEADDSKANIERSALTTPSKNPFRIQILEPRLMYSYTPYRQQNSPIFDAAEPEFGFSSLFNEQRYIGHDRISDQHQLTMGVAFTALNQKAQEDFWLNVGQRYQFNDSKVSLNNMPNERLNRGFSDVLLQARAMKYKTISSDFDAQYNPKQSKLIKLNIGMNWQPNDDDFMKLSYRYRKNSPTLNQTAIKQLALEGGIKLKDNWRLSSYASYDLENKRLSQAIAGVEYMHACWRLKVGVDRTITTNNQYTTKAIVKISLNGLGN